MSDIIFCDICGKETKEQTLGGSVCFTRSVVACDECVVSNQDNLDKAMSVAFEEFMVSIRDLKGIEINQEAKKEENEEKRAFAILGDLSFEIALQAEECGDI